MNTLHRHKIMLLGYQQLNISLIKTCRWKSLTFGVGKPILLPAWHSLFKLTCRFTFFFKFFGDLWHFVSWFLGFEGFAVSHKQVRNIRSLNSRSLPIPLVVPLGGTGQLHSFRSHNFFPAKTANSIFPPKGQRNVGRCGKERVAGEHGCAGGAGGEFRGTTSDNWPSRHGCYCKFATATCGSKRLSSSHCCCWWAKQIPRAAWCWT